MEINEKRPFFILDKRVWGIVLLLSIPLILLRAGFSLVTNQNSKEKLSRAQILMNAECEDLKIKSADSDQYFSARIRDIYWSSWTDANELKLQVLAFLKSTNIKARVLIWDKDKVVKHCNFAYQKSAGDWDKAFETLHNFRSKKKYSRLSEFPADELINLRVIFGTTFYPNCIFTCADSSNPSLIRSSFSDNANLLWLHAFHNGGLAIFVSPGEIKKFSALKFEIKVRNSRKALPGQLFLIKRGKAFPANDPMSTKLERIYQQKKPSFKKRFEAENLVINNIYVDEETSISGIMRKNSQQNLFLEHKTNLISLVWLIFTFFLTLHYRNKPLFDLKLRFQQQLLLLFLLSSAVPMLGFASVAYDYINEYKASRFSELHRLSFKFLQGVDESSIVAISDQIRTIEKTLDVWKKQLRKHGVKKADVLNFIASQSPRLRNIFLIGSHTKKIAFEDGIISKTKILEQFGRLDLQKNSRLIKQARAVDVIFKSFLAEINGTKLTGKQGLELEMVFDSLTQTDSVIFIQNFFESMGSLWQWGFGETQYSNYLKLFSVFSPGTYDYSFLGVLDIHDLAKKFIENYFHSFNRNDFGLKLFARTGSKKYFPEDISENNDIRQFINSIDEQSSGKSATLAYQGEDYFATGLRGFHNRSLQLMAMYPISKIENESDKMTKDFFLLAILSTLVTVGLSLSISKSVVEPVADLKKGVKALNSRNFSYRLPDLGKNEFGQLSEIFNRTLVDMEELHVAKFVQEKLIPQMDENMIRDQLLIFGKTESLNDLGGDYFDILQVSESHTGLILGDVAGHGVAASMIMAFVKACVLKLEKLHDSPLALINQLNQLLRVTRNKKQRKFMSFQYLLFNNESGDFQYVNAGHCFPIVVDAREKTADFLPMINSPLGTSNKKMEELQTHKLQCGQAAVLYSDGYYEIQGMTLEDFRLILIDCYDSDPKTYFEKIVSKMNSEGLEQTDDDKTLLIVSRKLS